MAEGMATWVRLWLCSQVVVSSLSAQQRHREEGSTVNELMGVWGWIVAGRVQWLLRERIQNVFNQTNTFRYVHWGLGRVSLIVVKATSRPHKNDIKLPSPFYFMLPFCQFRIIALKKNIPLLAVLAHLNMHSSYLFFCPGKRCLCAGHLKDRIHLDIFFFTQFCSLKYTMDNVSCLA